MIFLLASSSWADFILDAIEKLMNWAVQKAQDLIGWDPSFFDITNAINQFKDIYAFLDVLMPITTTLNILLAAFVAKAVIRAARHIIGYIPGVDG